MVTKERSLNLWAAVLLLIGGLMNLLPIVYERLTTLTDGTPWIQIVIGILSVIVSLVMFAGDGKPAQASSSPRQ